MPSGTILLIDDEEDIRVAVQDILEAEGYSVAIAKDGKEGLDTLKRIEKPCLILLDLMMPVMDGWAVLKELRSQAQWAAIPVIILSAAGEKTRFAKAEGVLKKPVELGQLLSFAERYC